MERIVVSVRHRDGGPGRDLEVPAEVPAAELASLLAEALGRPDRVELPAAPQIEVVALGRRLEPHATLGAAGAWDGADLVIHPAGPPAAPHTVPKERRKQGTSWKRLDD